MAVEANNIEPLQEDFSEVCINEEEEREILKLSKDPKIYEKLTNSIAPSIYGHERVKEAIVLQLMGGVRKVKEDGTITRGDMHVLLVGDPGAGKSQILTFVSKVAPRARLVSGQGASGAGLTAAVVKDEFIKGWALEAGALVLANGGFCVIDELDKMSDEDRSAMHQALEQQVISISKANIQATLKAQASVLAAANPKLGRFDPYDPIAQQINLPATLINRFDLIFPIRDIPQRERDEKIATHVLALQKNPKSIEPEIQVTLLRKYISYARQKLFPTLTEEAIEEIKQFYVDLRSSGSSNIDAVKPVPISARQLEALVRLAEGSARTRLSKRVIKKDAIRAIELLKYCFQQVGIDPETGQIDIDRISTGIPSSTRSKIVTVRSIINDLCEQSSDKTTTIKEIIDYAKEYNINDSQVEEYISQLKRTGDIFEPKPGFIQKL